jgi:hypothetical protein
MMSYFKMISHLSFRLLFPKNNLEREHVIS